MPPETKHAQTTFLCVSTHAGAAKLHMQSSIGRIFLEGRSFNTGNFQIGAAFLVTVWLTLNHWLCFKQWHSFAAVRLKSHGRLLWSRNLKNYSTPTSPQLLQHHIRTRLARTPLLPQPTALCSHYCRHK